MNNYLKGIALLLITLFPVACSDKYDDTELRKAISSLEDRVDALETARDAYKNNLLVESVTPTSDGYIIVFSDGSNIEIVNDKAVELPPDKDTCYLDHIEVGEDKVTFYLSDGTDFSIKMAYALALDFEIDNLELLMIEGQERKIPFSVVSEIKEVDLEVFTSADIKAKVESYDEVAGRGVLSVLCTANTDGYSKVVLLATNGRCLTMRRLAFTNEGIDVFDNSDKSASDTGGDMQLEFVSSVPVNVVIPESASSWISLLPESRTAEVRNIRIWLEPNYGGDREAEIVVAEQDGTRCVTFRIHQHGVRGFGEIDERKAVMDLFRGDIDVDSYANVPLSQFPGVTLDEDGHVSEIFAYEISKPMLPSIGNLIYLKKLDIEVLKGFERLPDEFGLLESLEYFKVIDIRQSNEAALPFPAQIYNLKNLRILDVHNLSGRLDSRISQLANLEQLKIGGAKLQSVDFDAICKLAKLKELNLYGNPLSGRVPDALFKLPGIESIQLSYTKLSGAVPADVWTNQNLRELCLGGLDGMSVALPSEIKAMKNLEVLYLSGTNLNGSLPSDIGECNKLMTLSFDFTGLSGEIPKSITKLSELESFAALFCNLTGPIPIGFANCPKLSNMQLSRNKLTGGITADLAGIADLWLYGNQLSGPIPRDFIENSKFWRNNWGKIYVDNNFDPLDLGFDGPDIEDFRDTAWMIPFRYVDEYPKHELTVIFQFTPNCQYYQQAYELLIEAHNKYAAKGLNVIGRTYSENEGFVASAKFPWPVYWTQQTDYPTYVVPTISFIDKNGKLIFSDLVQDRADIPAFLEAYFASK